MRAKRVDGNQKAITRDLRRLGYSVWDTSGVGEGGPDIVVGVPANKRNIMIEIKNPSGDRKLTATEKEFHVRWRGQIAVCESLEDVLDVIERSFRRW